MRITYNNPPVKNEVPYQKADNNASKIEKDNNEEVLESTEKVVKNSRKKCSISEKIKTMFVAQLQAELTNFSMYNSFAVWFETNGLDDLGKYYRARANEELNHHQWIMDYLSDCDADFKYPNIPNIDIDSNNAVQPFEITVDREIETTGGINRIASQACKEGDWGTISFLNGNYSDGKLIPEQIEEESISRTALDIMRMDASILRRQKEVYEFYFNKRK